MYTPPKPWKPVEWLTPDPLPFKFDRDATPVRQSGSWTCSCAAMAWVMNALGVEAPGGGEWNEWTAVSEIRRVGGAGAVTPEYGLGYGSGVTLEQVYAEYGFQVQRVTDVSWAALAVMCDKAIGQIGGGRWYHWTGLRGYDSEAVGFDLANPAPSWKGVGDFMSLSEWNSWGGWNAVMIVGQQ